MSIMTAAAAMAAILSLVPAAPPSGPDSPDATVVFETPAPGHAEDWSIPLGDAAAEADLTLSRASGRAIRGPAPLWFTLRSSAGVLLAEGTAAQLLGRTIAIGARSGGAVHVRAELPAAAGDEYRGATASLRFRVAPQPPAASDEGMWRVPAAIAVLIVVVAGTATTMLARRRREAADADQ